MKHQNQNLLEQLFTVTMQLRRFHLQSHHAHGPMGAPHRGQGRILALLRLKPEMSQKDLSKILDIRSQSLGELLAKLERSGYITRSPLEEDRRVMMIHLTEAGKSASEQGDDSLDLESILDCLEKDEQANLSNYLQRLSKRLEERLESSKTEPGFGVRGFGRSHHRKSGRFSAEVDDLSRRGSRSYLSKRREHPSTEEDDV